MSCEPDSIVKRVALPLAVFTAGGASPTADAVVLWMTNPSVLLTAMVSIVMQSERGAATAFSGAADWQIYPALPPTATDLMAPAVLAAAFAAPRPLPDGYVVDDPTKLLKIVATLASDINSAGTVWAIATWEPKDACLGPELRDALFARCSLTLEGGARNLKAGPGV